MHAVRHKQSLGVQHYRFTAVIDSSGTESVVAQHPGWFMLCDLV